MNFTWKQLESESNSQEQGSHTKKSETYIILAHGFGAHAGDLAPLAQQAPDTTKWLFPQAPVTLQPGSYAWFPSAARELQRIFDGEYFNHLEQMSVPELGERADQLIQDIEELGIPWEHCILGGFSQGSMLALRAAVEHRLPLRGLILLSSAAVDVKRLKELMSPDYQVPVFQSHGLSDPVLPYEGAVQLKELLETEGWNVQFQQFDGPHGIPQEVEREMIRFIGGRLH